VVRKSTATERRVPVPEDLAAIAQLRARGRTWEEIARDRGTTITNVLNWYRSRVEPVWKALAGKHIHEELAKLNELERECWRQYEASADAAAFDVSEQLKSLDLPKGRKREVEKVIKATQPTNAKQSWLVTIIAIIDLRCRLRGEFAPSRSQMSVDTSVRFAGSTPGQVNEEMMARLLAKVEERRNYEAALKQSEGSRN